jgi:hypothetical protein
MTIANEKPNNKEILFSSKVIYKKGEKLVIKGGTINSHSIYKGVQQTIIKNVKF